MFEPALDDRVPQAVKRLAKQPPHILGRASQSEHPGSTNPKGRHILCMTDQIPLIIVVITGKGQTVILLVGGVVPIPQVSNLVEKSLV